MSRFGESPAGGTTALASVLASQRGEGAVMTSDDVADASLARAWLRERGWDIGRGRGGGTDTDGQRAAMLAHGLADARGHRAVAARDQADAERALAPLRELGFDVVRGAET